MFEAMTQGVAMKNATKNVRSVHRGGEAHWVGDGFPVHTVFSYQDLGAELTPFLLLDHAGPTDFEPTGEERGVGWHPHRGFETVPLWVNLPAKSKMTSPRYQELLDGDIPVAKLPGDAGSVRVIAGEYEGAKGPARTFTPINLFDLRLRARHRARLDLREGWTAALFVLKGTVSVNGEAANEGELVVFEREGGEVAIEAASDATVFVMNGQPIAEPIAGYGPFVMNTQEQIRQAVADYQSGRLGRIPSTTH